MSETKPQKDVDHYTAEAERRMKVDGPFAPNMNNVVAGLGFVALAFLAHLREGTSAPGDQNPVPEPPLRDTAP